MAENEPLTVPKGIAKKLVAILDEVAKVEKKGKNRAQNYDFVRETDLVDKVRPLMAKSGLYLNLSVVDHELMEMGKTASGNIQRLTILTINGTWVDSETGEAWTLPATFVGYGADTGDKGVYKAMTGAEKYLLFKSFLVGTGDDPEADERTDRNPAVARRSSGPTRVTNAKPDSDVGRGGRAQTATMPQLRRLATLVNDAGLSTDGFRKVIARETGLTPPDGPINRWLASQPAGLVGKLIASVDRLVAPAEGPEAPDEGEGGDEPLRVMEDASDYGYGAGDDDLPLV